MQPKRPGDPWQRPPTGHRQGGAPGQSAWQRISAAPTSYKVLAGIGAFLALSVVVYAVNPHGGTHAPSAPAATVSRRAPSASATAPRPVAASKTAFPPKTLAAFRAFAATGDAAKVHPIARDSEGLPSCPEPNIIVTVSRRLTGQALLADLSAFFIQSGLINDHCRAFVFAFHSRRDYRAHRNDGYTAGRVALTTNSAGPPDNLEVDAGDTTSASDIFTTAKFDFNF
jgi:hypothetical protein